MTVRAKHAFVSAIPDGPDPAKVRATDWNADQAVKMVGPALIGKPDAGDGDVIELTAAQARTLADAEQAGVAAAAVAAHEAAADPHTGYQKESEKGNANGYASLDAGATIPDAQIPAAIARDAEVTVAIDAHAAGDVRDGDAAGGDLGDTYPDPTVVQARGLRETSGPTNLVVGAIADNEVAARSGATLIGRTISALLDLITSTRGSILYRGVAAWAGLAPGAATHVLTSNGAGADPSYQAVAGGSGTDHVLLLPTGNKNIPADSSIIVGKRYQLASGIKLTIESGANLCIAG